MKAPTGKLAFAYRTIAALEGERDTLRAEVEALRLVVDASEDVARQLQQNEDVARIRADALRAEVEWLREIREIASQCAANGGYLNSQDLIELRELLQLLREIAGCADTTGKPPEA